MNASDKLKKYKCPTENCNASYTKKCRLEVHIRKHTEERPFICDIGNCSKSYTNSAHLKRHKCLSHEKACEELCPEKGCGLVFNNKYSLKKHLNQRHSSGPSNAFKCEHCPEQFKQKRQLKRHLYLHAGKAALTCSICNIIFGSLHLYNKHKSNHQIYTCDCGSVFNRWSEFCRHRRESCKIKIDHKCEICNKVFKTKVNLRSHSRTHSKEGQIKVYSCPHADCKRSYQYKKNLDYHICVFHQRKNDEIRISCTAEECSMQFKSKKNLKQHLANIHSGAVKKEKPRQPRKDKGKRKICMASILSGVPLPLKENLQMIKKNEDESTKGVEDVKEEDNELNETATKHLLSIEAELKQKFVFILRDFNISEYSNVNGNVKDFNGLVTESLVH